MKHTATPVQSVEHAIEYTAEEVTEILTSHARLHYALHRAPDGLATLSWPSETSNDDTFILKIVTRA